MAPDTSPRGANIPGESDNWDFGVGAGFYVDATQTPWSKHYRMYSYVTEELPGLIAANFPARMDRQRIFGHSMGGHGALVCALRNPQHYMSVSAFAPIAAPMRCPWGQKAFTNYLGPDRETWHGYDASELVPEATVRSGILASTRGRPTGSWPSSSSLKCSQRHAGTPGEALSLRRQEGYDHGYYFISTFVENHLYFHHGALIANED